MISSDNKLITDSSVNRVSCYKNIMSNKSTSIRSHSIANSKFNSQVHSKSIINTSHAFDPIKTMTKYTYHVGKGNNENLIKKILNERGCWSECQDSTSTFVSFKWQQDQKGYHYNRLVDSGLYKSAVNHFQFHSCLCNKEFLFRNLEAYCLKINENVWSIVPPTFILNVKDQMNMQILKIFIDYYLKHFPRQLKLKQTDYQKNAVEFKRKLKYYFFNSNQKKNPPKLPPMEQVFIYSKFLPGISVERSIKSSENHQILDIQNQLSISTLPHSQPNISSLQSANTIDGVNQQKQRINVNLQVIATQAVKSSPKLNKQQSSLSKSQMNCSYLWIVKPTFLNRGRGIQVFSRLDQLYTFINENVTGYIEKSLNCVEQIKQKTIIDYVKRNSQQIKMIMSKQEDMRPKRQANFLTNVKTNDKDPSTIFDGNQYIRVIPKVPSLIKTDCFLIQKYLERPLLILNRKFDIRLWVLVTHNLTCFVFKEGYVRLSSSQYSTQATDSQVHLTNNAVQKYTENYGKIVEGNQMGFKEVEKVMAQKGLDFGRCLSNIHNQVEISLSATVKKLNPLNRRYVFEIFGYDFMIDQSGKPWLIEVNNNPCIQESSKIVSKLLHRMIDDAFKLTIDVLFPGASYAKKYPVEGYRDNENLWKALEVKK